MRRAILHPDNDEAHETYTMTFDPKNPEPTWTLLLYALRKRHARLVIRAMKQIVSRGGWRRYGRQETVLFAFILTALHAAKCIAQPGRETARDTRLSEASDLLNHDRGLVARLDRELAAARAWSLVSTDSREWRLASTQKDSRRKRGDLWSDAADRRERVSFSFKK